MKYSIIKIITNDWPSLAASIGLPIIWALHIFFPFIKKIPYGLPILFPITVSLSLLALLLWRIKRIARLFISGKIANGQITSLSIVKDRGRLEFTFEHNGSRISSWIPVHKTKLVLSFTAGTPVTVIYDPNNPAKSIIMELFTQ